MSRTRGAAVTLLAAGLLLAPAGAQDARDQFFSNLERLCGARFEGTMTFPTEGRDDFSGKLLVATVESCGAAEIRVPFRVGEDRSRTWIFRRSAEGLQLKHDHRHTDGTPDAITMYGGWATAAGSALEQSFAADDDTIELIPEAATNLWTVSLDADGTRLTYHLERDGKPRFTAILRRTPGEPQE